MEEITCDDCGTLNEARRDQCELCGASLDEEKERRERWGQLLMLPVGYVFISGMVFVSIVDFATISEDTGRHRSILDVFGALHRGGWSMVLTSMIVGAIITGGLAWWMNSLQSDE
jgi:uncharacterized protein (DUF983 family)